MAWDSLGMLAVGEVAYNTVAALMVDLYTRAAVEGIPTHFAPLGEAVKVVDSMQAAVLSGVPLWAVRQKAVAAGSHSIVR